MLKIYKPNLEDLWFREKILNDKETMSYNNHWGGVIPFPKEKWEGWFDYWIANPDSKRYYRYLVNENNDYVGEIAYHFDGEHYLANVIIFAKYRHKGYGSEGLQLLCEKAKENGMKEVYSFDNIEEGAELLNKIMKSKDIIVFKASNAMKLGDIIPKIK